ncbi:hypothetical protein Pmar_PMAR016257 [Perkinsus marinus ATCC 50983]|uniref:Uncharacterized protein n=1 Tax=Perkinsus marinus (strain ATCC 50983 / TXsc) TaxID=423536 RepID=C5KYN1_PERM5|nr:hypothetical protein Pmar_PMAR016257 [Perkinsus marinus ATCC 50983]EER10409.1 hypothetical protein Pmar_PMAR016257 [Perkinsus marinus ATCC 50983]|eukprot:XP_002778614.1 hypothetical protein Pmar_PMAR016257 [Perkinsus marinus ATCC 50983]
MAAKAAACEWDEGDVIVLDVSARKNKNNGLSILEQYGSVQPIPSLVWQQSELVNDALDRGEVDKGLRLATSLIQSGPIFRDIVRIFVLR